MLIFLDLVHTPWDGRYKICMFRICGCSKYLTPCCSCVPNVLWENTIILPNKFTVASFNLNTGLWRWVLALLYDRLPTWLHIKALKSYNYHLNAGRLYKRETCHFKMPFKCLLNEAAISCSFTSTTTDNNRQLENMGMECEFGKQ